MGGGGLISRLESAQEIVAYGYSRFSQVFPFLSPQMSSLPRNLSWTKLFWEKSGWRGEEGDVLLEGLARNVFKEFYNSVNSLQIGSLLRN